MKMPRGSCENIRAKLWRYIDRELTAQGLAELSAHLKACPECSRTFHEQAREARLYRAAFAGAPFGENFVERFRAQLAAEPPPAFVDLGAAPEPVRPAILGWILPAAAFDHPRKFLARAALAAALLAIGASVFFGFRSGSSLGTFEALGTVALVRGGLPGGAARDIRPGDAFRLDRTGDEVRLLLRDGTRLAFEGPGEFKVRETSSADGPFHVEIVDTGFLTATVMPQKPGRGLEVITPDAVTRVIGTQFTLQVERGAGTVLRVREGKVWFRGRSTDLEPVLVDSAAGPYGIASGRVRRIEAPVAAAGPASSPVPTSIPEAEPGDGSRLLDGPDPNPAGSGLDGTEANRPPGSGSTKPTIETDLPVHAGDAR
jgi:hypothetical protein